MEVHKIQAQINQIRVNLEKLQKRELPEISQFEQKANEIVSTRHRSIEDYKEKEIEAAHKLYDGMINGIDTDYDNSLSKVYNHIQEFIIFKKNQLCKDFPEAAQYFETQTENCSFLQLIDSLPQNRCFSGNENDQNEIEVSLAQGNLILNDEIDQRYNELQNIELFRIDQGLLYKGEEPFLSPGDNVSLCLKESRCYNGIINQIQNFIEINISGAIIKIPVSALNIGIATISPN
ncbi:hypothetical protein M9Y10_038962 [Tritrichomonas musculus]|uniref:Uncharacterized protein n=1 Tax=Tritrichomonas musculus TaxID=1915356 RepID=A0ABR2K9V1_9EUKA